MAGRLHIPVQAPVSDIALGPVHAGEARDRALKGDARLADFMILHSREWVIRAVPA